MESTGLSRGDQQKRGRHWFTFRIDWYYRRDLLQYFVIDTSVNTDHVLFTCTLSIVSYELTSSRISSTRLSAELDDHQQTYGLLQIYLTRPVV